MIHGIKYIASYSVAGDELASESVIIPEDAYDDLMRELKNLRYTLKVNGLTMEIAPSSSNLSYEDTVILSDDSFRMGNPFSNAVVEPK